MTRLLCTLVLALALTACMTDDDGDLATGAVALSAVTDDSADVAALDVTQLDDAAWSLPNRIAPRTPVHLRDAEVATGRSCMTCHDYGMIAKNDQIRDRVP